MRFVLATNNPAKAAELAELLGDTVELLPRPAGVPEVIEDAETLEGNARLKAAALVDATGLAAIADDTGLEVDALGGEPGVRSARYAGPEGDSVQNIAKLLARLEEVGAEAPERRRARFRTVVVARWPGGREVTGRGVVEGSIAAGPRGAAGFGYDSVFVPDEGDGRTFAEMSAAGKHAISHRGRAIRSLAAALGLAAQSRRGRSSP